MPDFAHAAGMVAYSQPGVIPLFYDDDDRDTEKGTIIAGTSGLTAFPRGTLLGRVGVTANWTLALAASSDGSQVPRGVLAQDCDLSGGSIEGIVYTSGEFNERALTLGTGIVLTVAVRDALKALGFIFKAGINP